VIGSVANREVLAARFRGLGTTIFSEMNQLAAAHGAVNLGQGAPSFDGPEFIKEAAIESIRAGHNQYVRGHGQPDFVRAVAEHEHRFYGLGYDPEEEVTVSAGATEALFVTLQGLLDPGDEVILFEPYYDSYMAGVAAAGAEARVLTLEAPDFRLDPAAVEAAVTDRTRLVLLNTPHNPTGRVFSREELEGLAEVCRRHDLLVISDEVYEHLVFAGEHLPIATLPGMWERTLTISSAGKTFSLTGWKIGWICAPAHLSRAVRAVHQFTTFCQPAPFQRAMAVALRTGDEYFDDYLAHYRRRREHLCQGLAEVGFGVTPPQGTYFVLADIRPLGYDDDMAFCRMLPERVGVAAIPNSAFYLHKERGRHLVRFAFCKQEAVIDQAVAALARLGAEGR